MYLWNSVSEDFQSLYDVEMTVRHDGTVKWLPPGLVKSSCKVNMYLFPFGTQICELRFGSWSHTKDLINFSHRTPNKGNLTRGSLVVSDTFHYSSSEWEIISTDGVLNEAEYPCCPGKIYQDFVFQVKLKRYRFTPIIVLIVPCLMISSLAILTFFVPPGAGEKIGLSKWQTFCSCCIN